MSANILDRRGFAMAAGRALGIGFVAGLTLPRQGFAAEAQAPARGDIYIAEKVPVDVTAASVTDARDRGLVQGRVNGLRKVLARMVAPDDLARVPTLSSAQIIDMVRNFSIANERTSAVRYLADLTVRFDPDAVRRLLRDAGIPFAETMSKPLVVVPLLRTPDGKSLLWEENNPWRVAWAMTASVNGLVPVYVPGGEPKDPSALAVDQALTVDQALARDASALAALAAAYGAGGTLVAMAQVNGQEIRVTMDVARQGLPDEEFSASASAAPGDELFAAGARAAIAAVEGSWRERNTVTFGDVGQITALVPLEGLKDWLTVRERLTGVSLIQRIDLQAITRDRAQVMLYFAGERDQLSLAMSQRDLTLTQTNGVWVIGALAN